MSVPAASSTDILVIGGGPAGLYAAFYAALRGLSVRILEARPELGSQLYPDRKVYDVPAAPAAYAGQIVERLVRQLGPFDIDVRLGEVARTLQQCGAGWQVSTGGRVYPARAVILAAGLGTLLPRPASLPGLHTDWPTPGIIRIPKNSVTLRNFFERSEYDPVRVPGIGKTAGGVPGVTEMDGIRISPPETAWVQGGVPQATRAALELAAFGTRVTLSHRRALFRGTPQQLERLERYRQAGQITVQAPVEAGFSVSAAATWQLNGYLPDLSPIQGWPLGWQGEYVPAGTDGQTRLPGVYVAGDLSFSGGDFKLIALAFAQSALCANHAAHFVRPELKVRPGHSSDRRLPQRG